MKEILVLSMSTSSSEDMVKGDISYFVTCTDACNVDSFIYVLTDRLLSVSKGCSRIIARAVEARLGYHDRTSGPWVHLPRQWLILNSKCQDRVPSFRFCH